LVENSAQNAALRRARALVYFTSIAQIARVLQGFAKFLRWFLQQIWLS
jgi:hypothetical protein